MQVMTKWVPLTEAQLDEFVAAYNRFVARWNIIESNGKSPELWAAGAAVSRWSRGTVVSTRVSGLEPPRHLWRPSDDFTARICISRRWHRYRLKDFCKNTIERRHILKGCDVDHPEAFDEWLQQVW
jgi:hypothetical protein